MLTEGDCLVSHQAGGRIGLGREDSHPFAPGSISDRYIHSLVHFLSKPKFCSADRPFPRPKLQLCAVPINQEITGEMAIKGKQTANSFIKVQKHFSWSSISSVKAVALFKWKQHLE